MIGQVDRRRIVWELLVRPKYGVCSSSVVDRRTCMQEVGFGTDENSWVIVGGEQYSSRRRARVGKLEERREEVMVMFEGRLVKKNW